MTDNEIIQACQHCFSHTDEDACMECPYDYEDIDAGMTCTATLKRDVLNLINRQKAEIERLKNTLDDVLDRQPLLVERAEKYAKSEAYKELAEELKGYCSDIDTDNINEPTVRILWDAEETIDYVVKELTEENK